MRILGKTTPKLFTDEFVNKKLDGLRQRGFGDPVKMINTWPSILRLAFDNIDRKLRYASKLRRFGVNGIALAEVSPQLLTYSIKRICLYTRITFSLENGDQEIFVTLITAKKPLTVVENDALMRCAKDRKLVRLYYRYKAA